MAFRSSCCTYRRRSTHHALRGQCTLEVRGIVPSSGLRLLHLQSRSQSFYTSVATRWMIPRPSSLHNRQFSNNQGKLPDGARADLRPSQQSDQDWRILKKLLPNIWPKDNLGTKIRVTAALGLLIGGKLLNVQVPFFFKGVVDAFSGPIDPMTSQGVWAIGGTVILGYGLARICAAAFSELRSAVFASVAQSAIRRVARGIAFMLTSIVFHVVPTALEISMVCGILTYNFGWNFAAITLTTMAAYTWFTVRTTAWRIQFRKRANAADNDAATRSIESLINYEAVKYFNNEKYEIARYDKALESYEKASVKIYTSLAMLNTGQNVIFSTALTAMMYLAACGVMEGTMSIGDLVMINQLVFQLSLPLNFLGTVYRELRQSFIDMDVLFKLQETTAAIKDDPKPDTLRIRGGQITFENVTFGYGNGRRIFDNISFTIPAGSKVAIVGPSGCGKSTVLRLCFRFYEPDSGRILIDDQDIRQVSLSSLREAIGVVPQETPLFHESIMHNIRYGKLDASDEEVKHVARLANVAHTIESLPEGWNTNVGERGLMISGGEKQRLSVARLLLKNSPILFFDEATSALDTQTEQKLMQNIHENLTGGKKTSIFVAHRLKTIANADVIIVLKEGRVVEQGKHGELMLIRDGVYRDMWLAQATGVDDLIAGASNTTPRSQ